MSLAGVAILVGLSTCVFNGATNHTNRDQTVMRYRALRPLATP